MISVTAARTLHRQHGLGAGGQHRGLPDRAGLSPHRRRRRDPGGRLCRRHPGASVAGSLGTVPGTRHGTAVAEEPAPIAQPGGRAYGLCPEDRPPPSKPRCTPGCDRPASGQVRTCCAVSRRTSARVSRFSTIWTIGGPDDRNKLTCGLDVLASRPTLLRAFASGFGPGLAAQSPPDADPQTLVAQTHKLYTDSGAFTKAERLLAKLRARALAAAGEFESPDLQELMRFLVRMVLPEK